MRESQPQPAGVTLLQGTFSATFAEVSLSLKAALDSAGNVQLNDTQASVPSAAFALQGDPQLANGKSAQLRPLVVRALNRATFIEDVTRERVRIALEGSNLGATVCTLLAKALQPTP
jgi:hypothetical protein